MLEKINYPKLAGENLNLAINSSKIILNAQRLKGFTTGLDTRFFDVLAAEGFFYQVLLVPTEETMS